MSYNEMASNKERDPFLSLSIRRIQQLVDGINIYKKFNTNTLITNKAFDMSNPAHNPENCGYAMRLFKINPNEETLEIINQKKRSELKIQLKDIKGILLCTSAKNTVKQKKSINARPNGEITRLIADTEYIPFNLLLTTGNIDLIASNYLTFKSFEEAVEEIVKRRKTLISILKYFH